MNEPKPVKMIFWERNVDTRGQWKPTKLTRDAGEEPKNHVTCDWMHKREWFPIGFDPNTQTYLSGGIDLRTIAPRSFFSQAQWDAIPEDDKAKMLDGFHKPRQVNVIADGLEGDWNDFPFTVGDEVEVAPLVGDDWQPDVIVQRVCLQQSGDYIYRTATRSAWIRHSSGAIRYPVEEKATASPPR